MVVNGIPLNSFRVKILTTGDHLVAVCFQATIVYSDIVTGYTTASVFFRLAR